MVLVESFSGIRGVYGKDLNDDVARRYAYSYYKFLKRKKDKPVIVIGTDTRASSEPIKNAVIDVFEEMIDVGIATTPMIELAVRVYKADGGIIITASHNEPEWNGFKFLNNKGSVLMPEEMAYVISKFKEIEKIKEDVFLNEYLYKNEGKIKNIVKKDRDIIKKYADSIVKIIGKKYLKKIKNFKVLLDPNGGSGIILRDVLKKIGLKYDFVNDEPGKFARKIEPNEESLGYLKDRIKQDYGLGAGFDCDADRVEIILDNGIVSGQYILAMVVDEILSSIKNPEKEFVVVNDATSNIVREVAAKYNAKIKETSVGEINVLNSMLMYNSPAGGEGSSSGAIIPPSRCRDGILSLLIILRMMAKQNKSIKDILSSYAKYYNLRAKILFKHEVSIKKDKLKRYYLRKGYTSQESGDKSSLKIIVDRDSFVWFRPSKTEEGIFRVMADSKSEEKAKQLFREAVSVLKAK